MSPRAAFAGRGSRPAAALASAALLAGIALSPLPAHAEGESLIDHAVTTAEGADVTVPLLDGATGAQPGTARLLLDGLPAGSTLTVDGHRAVVPEQGTWQIAADGSAVSFTPYAPRLGIEPSPIRYSALTTAGQPVGPAIVTVRTPVIPDMLRAAPYGSPVVFPVTDAAQDIDVSTLTLSALRGTPGSTVTDDGTRVDVAGQGTWRLDRTSGSVTFTPGSSAVTAVAPVRVSGRSGAGERASAALLEVGYPVLADRCAAEQPGEDIQFDLLEGSRNIAAGSLRFQLEGSPRGAQLSGDGLTLTVPSQGQWTLDPDARTAVFEPVAGLTRSPDPVAYAASGLYADTAASARLRGQYTPSPPIARADELRGRPGRPLQLDLLANDTPGTASIPLRPASVRISSPVAAGIPQLSSDRGTRVVVPGEATYTVSADGVLTVEPSADFRGVTTPIEYTVQDAAGVCATGTVSVDIDPQAPQLPARRDSGGINSMLEGLRAASTSTFTVFITVAALLIFSGFVSLWIGFRMEADRRSP